MKLRALLLEDNPEDAELVLRTLKLAQFDVTADITDAFSDFMAHARRGSYDVILSDYRLPGTTGMECFAALKAERIETPFVLVTGSLGDEHAVECLKEGVADYVLKDGLARLPVAVRRALREQKLREEEARAEEALRRSEASYRSLIQSAPCGILRVSAKEGNILELNGAMAELLGYPSAASFLAGPAAGVSLLSEGVLGRLAKDCSQDRVGECEIEWKQKQGQPVLMRLSGRLLQDESQSPVCFEMIAENVTERRQAQELIFQLNRLYSVLSHAGRAIVRNRERMPLFQEICRILVEQGHFTLAGLAEPGTRSMPALWPVPSKSSEPSLPGPVTGKDPVKTAIETGMHAISTDIGGDGGNAAMGAFPIFLEGSVAGAIVICSRDAQVFDHETVCLLEELAANVSFALESLAADQRRHQAVAEMDKFFALSLDMLAVLDFGGEMKRMNPAWEKTLGFSPAELSSKPWLEFIHPEDRRGALDALKRLRSGDAIPQFELRVVSKSGSYRCLAGSAAPLLGEQIIFAALNDITDHKLLEERLQSQNIALEQQNRRVNEASRMKSEFLANMSHELRSPLNGIIGFTELLDDGRLGPLSDRPKEFIGRIHKSALHLLELINRVLDLSKIEAGHLEFRPEPVSLAGVVQEVVGTFGALAAGKRIAIETEVAGDLGEVVIDASRFKQILYNYLSNALKFTGAGGRVSVRAALEGPSDFRVEVSDTGVGIAASDLPRLFVEFQQLDTTAAKPFQGTGLGLALTKHLVEAQGGRVGVESAVGQGSTFYAVLPRMAIAWPMKVPGANGIHPTPLACR